MKRRKEMLKFTFPATQSVHETISGETLVALAPVTRRVTFNRRRLNPNTPRILTTLTRSQNPPPQSHNLHVQRHGRTVPERLHRDRREQRPTTCPPQLLIIYERAPIVLLRVAAYAIVPRVAIEQLEVGLHHGRWNEARATQPAAVTQEYRVV